MTLTFSEVEFISDEWYRYTDDEDEKILNSVNSAEQYSKWLKANNVTDIDHEPLINNNLQIQKSTGENKKI